LRGSVHDSLTPRIVGRHTEKLPQLKPNQTGNGDDEDVLF